MGEQNKSGVPARATAATEHGCEIRGNRNCGAGRSMIKIVGVHRFVVPPSLQIWRMHFTARSKSDIVVRQSAFLPGVRNFRDFNTSDRGVVQCVHETQQVYAFSCSGCVDSFSTGRVGLSNEVYRQWRI